MASTVWKGQLTFGLVSFPVRLVRAARKERIPLRYVRVQRSETDEEESEIADQPSYLPDAGSNSAEDIPVEVSPVRQSYLAEGLKEPLPARELQRGYEVEPEKFVVVRPEELRRLRIETSRDMQILRSVRMEEIDPVFLETSYYVVPGSGGERPYALFYRALTETKYAALAQVAMHGREHVIVVRAGQKGLIAHTMYYVNEVRGAEEHAANASDVAGKELDLAKRFVEAIAESFRPEEFTDSYRERLESLISSKEAVPKTRTASIVRSTPGEVVDIMEALRKSLETANARKETTRKPAKSERPSKKRKRRA